MGTSGTFEFCIGFLEITAYFEGSYGAYAEFSNIPTFWRGKSESQSSLYIFEVTELIKYWDSHPPGYKALEELHILLKNTPIEKIECYPDPQDGFQFDGLGKITLDFGD